MFWTRISCARRIEHRHHLEKCKRIGGLYLAGPRNSTPDSPLTIIVRYDVSAQPSCLVRLTPPSMCYKALPHMGGLSVLELETSDVAQ